MSETHLSGGAGRVLLLGAAPEAEPVLDALVRAPVKVVGVVTLERSGAADVALRGLVADRQIPLRPTKDPAGVATLRWMQGLRPALVVCAGWEDPLPPAVLSLAPRGVVRLHPSLAPRQRPHSAVSWAILRGEQTTGCSLLLLGAGSPVADLVDQRQVPITVDDTCATLGERLARAGAELLSARLPQLLSGTAPRRPQAPVRRSAALPERTPEMGITSFDRTTSEVHNWIRAQTRPCSGAYAFLRGRRVVLWRAERMAGHQTHAPPGTVLGADEGGVVVTTRTGAVRLLEVEGPGGAAEPAAEWFTREQLPPGCVFDPVDQQTLDWALGRRRGTRARGDQPRSAGAWTDPQRRGR